MATQTLLNRYIWIVDTIRQYGSITPRELNECFLRSPFSGGDPLPRRSFYNNREAIKAIFGLTIEFDAHTNSYFIKEDRENGGKHVNNWLLNSAAIANMLSDSRDVSHLIFFEEVPSARHHLDTFIKALKEKHVVKFDYHPYTRIYPKTGLILEPYFLKIFRQRWYVTGRNVADKAIKTYALDRMLNVTLTTDEYTIPEDFDPAKYFHNSFGIVFDEGEVRDVEIRVDPKQAKYFRALPLHHSQSERLCDGYSLFSYRLKLTSDFVAELLSYGPRVVVESPEELRSMMITSLKETLKKYV